MIPDKRNDNGPSRVLVLQLGGIGDLLMSFPSLRALRQNFPDARTALATLGRAEKLVRGSAYIDELFVFDSISLPRIVVAGNFRKIWATLLALRRERFDLLINLKEVSSMKGALKFCFIAAVIGAHRTIIVRKDQKKNRHYVDTMLDLMRGLGAETADRSVRLSLDDATASYANGFFAAHVIPEGRPVIGLSPLASRDSRLWPEERWVELAEALVDRLGAHVIISGDPGNRKKIEKIAARAQRKEVCAAAQQDIKQLSGIISRMSLFITSDSGPMHLAASVGTPVIGMFGPGDTRKFRPYTGQNMYMIIRKDVDCKRPCYRTTCRSMKCMKAITVDEMIKAAETMITHA